MRPLADRLPARDTGAVHEVPGLGHQQFTLTYPQFEAACP